MIGHSRLWARFRFTELEITDTFSLLDRNCWNFDRLSRIPMTDATPPQHHHSNKDATCAVNDNQVEILATTPLARMSLLHIELSDRPRVPKDVGPIPKFSKTFFCSVLGRSARAGSLTDAAAMSNLHDTVIDNGPKVSEPDFAA